jgi:hypothetical protein
MAELHCDLSVEQIAYCKIKTDLDLVYGENALPYRTIARWLSVFKELRTNVKDDPRPGRPISTGLSASYVFSILKEK